MADDDVYHELGRHDACYECGRPGKMRGFYGQDFCSRTCDARFLDRMHHSQDEHARTGFTDYGDAVPDLSHDLTGITAEGLTGVETTAEVE